MGVDQAEPRSLTRSLVNLPFFTLCLPEAYMQGNWQATKMRL